MNHTTNVMIIHLLLAIEEYRHLGNRRTHFLSHHGKGYDGWQQHLNLIRDDLDLCFHLRYRT